MQSPAKLHRRRSRGDARRLADHFAEDATAYSATVAPEAERALVGELLLSPNVLERLPQLHADDFQNAQLGLIFGAVDRMHRAGRSIDTVTLREELVARNELALAGGDEALLALTDTIPVRALLLEYARIVRARATRRRLRHACLRLAYATEGEECWPQLVADLETALEALRRHHATASVRSLEELLAHHERLEPGVPKRERCRSGVTELDRVVGGWLQGEVVCLGTDVHAARIDLALRAVRAAARQGTVVIATPTLPRDVLHVMEVGSVTTDEQACARILIVQESDSLRHALEQLTNDHDVSLLVAGDWHVTVPASAADQLARARVLKRIAEERALPVLATWPVQRSAEALLLQGVDALLTHRQSALHLQRGQYGISNSG